jgi:hypothetical protein
MHYLVTDMITENLPQAIREYLKICGLSEEKIGRCNMMTRLYHDLGIYGEVAESYMEVLVDSFNVDLTTFLFERYFPLEFPGRSCLSRYLLWQIPFARRLAEKRATYDPVTLEMIDTAIRTKKWPEPVIT